MHMVLCAGDCFCIVLMSFWRFVCFVIACLMYFLKNIVWHWVGPFSHFLVATTRAGQRSCWDFTSFRGFHRGACVVAFDIFCWVFDEHHGTMRDSNSLKGCSYAWDIRRAWEGQFFGSPRAVNTVDGLPGAEISGFLWDTSGSFQGAFTMHILCPRMSKSVQEGVWRCSPGSIQTLKTLCFFKNKFRFSRKVTMWWFQWWSLASRILLKLLGIGRFILGCRPCPGVFGKPIFAWRACCIEGSKGPTRLGITFLVWRDDAWTRAGREGSTGPSRGQLWLTVYRAHTSYEYVTIITPEAEHKLEYVIMVTPNAPKLFWRYYTNIFLFSSFWCYHNDVFLFSSVSRYYTNAFFVFQLLAQGMTSKPFSWKTGQQENRNCKSVQTLVQYHIYVSSFWLLALL